MTIVQQAQKILDVGKLALPPHPRVLSIEAKEFEDSSGNEALRLQVLLDEDTDIDHISGKDVIELKRAIRESLRAKGITLFPYIFMAKPSELATTADEE